MILEVVWLRDARQVNTSVLVGRATSKLRVGIGRWLELAGRSSAIGAEGAWLVSVFFDREDTNWDLYQPMPAREEAKGKESTAVVPGVRVEESR